MKRLAVILVAALAPVMPMPDALAQDSGFNAFPPDSPAPRAFVPGRPPAPPQPATPPRPAPAPPQPATPPVPAPEAWLARPIVVLVGLDKVSARTTTLSGPVGQELTFGTLTVLPRACVTRPPNAAADAAAFLEITDTRLNTRPFSAWMLLSEPAVSIFEHPVYDIRLVGCRAAP